MLYEACSDEKKCAMLDRTKEIVVEHAASSSVMIAIGGAIEPVGSGLSWKGIIISEGGDGRSN